MKKYESIGQFRDVIKNIKYTTRYEGIGDDDNPIFNQDSYPILEFTGTIKLHGTNAGIHYKSGILTPQSRNNTLSIIDDNYGFATWVHTHREKLVELIAPLGDDVMIYGEWAGEGIQKGVAISEIPDRTFFIFEIRIYDGTQIEEDECLTLNTFIRENYVSNPALLEDCPEIRLYNIHSFDTYSITIDFNNPELAIEQLIKITEAVESECPVAKRLGISGVGEGVVWRTDYKGKQFKFKVKGEKHAASKVKTLVSVDSEKVKGIIDFVELVVTENRVQQAMQETGATSNQDTPDILKWVANDIIKEETDTLLSNGFVWKDVANKVAFKTREIFFKKLIEV